jgi:hypothetical protein
MNPTNPSASKKAKKLYLIIILVAMLAVAGVFYWLSAKQRSSDTTTQKPTASNSNSNSDAGQKNGGLNIKPPQGDYKKNQIIEIEVRANTGGQAVNAVQADLSYPTNLLKFESIDTSGSAFSIKAEETGADGKVKIARGNIADVTGDVLVAKVKFKALGNAGTADIKVDDSSALVRSSDSSDILGEANGGKLTIED